MTHDEMIEVVARALCKLANGDRIDPDEKWNGQPWWAAFVDDARAAIRVIAPAVERALRERDQAVEALRALLDGGTHHEVDTGIGPMTEETPAAVHARTTLASIEGTGHDD